MLPSTVGDAQSTKIYRVVIIGSGVAGLALGLSLEMEFKNRMNISIYERDEGFDSRAQGYALTIQRNGMSALRKLKIEDDIKERADCLLTSNKTFAMTSDGLKLISGGKTKKKKDQLHTVLPRQELRKILLEHYERESGKQVNWNKGFKTFKEDRNVVTVEFDDGEVVECDVLVGCDGLMSGVRKEMKLERDLDASCFAFEGDYGQAQYLGVGMINGIADVSIDEELRKMTHNSVFQVLDGTCRLFVKPFSKNYSMWQLTFPLTIKSEEIAHYINEILPDKNKLLEWAKSKVEGWTHPIPLFVGSTSPDMMRGGLLHQSKLLSYDTLPSTKFQNVTIIGDSVHAMAPFKGQGMNNALCDVEELTDMLKKEFVENDGNLFFSKVFKMFEPKMINRSYKMVIKSKRLVDFLHSTDATDKEKHENHYRNLQHQDWRKDFK